MRIDAISGAGRADRGRVHANSRRLAGVYINGRSGGRRAELGSPLERWHCPGGGVRTRLRVGRHCIGLSEQLADQLLDQRAQRACVWLEPVDWPDAHVSFTKYFKLKIFSRHVIKARAVLCKTVQF